jgi:pimeloyl-ACP methyl ester carboxylesterase
MDERIEIRIHGDATLPALIHLPGLHGDWTLISSFRAAVAGKVRFVEFTYPRTTTWSLDDYADAVLAKLIEHNITRGWLLGESFGSQVVWPLLARLKSGQVKAAQAQSFELIGIILAGGFVRYPFPPAAKLGQILLERLPTWAVRTFFHIYAVVARLRHYRAPETFASIGDFISRRTPEDIAAMAHRLQLIRSSDPRSSALAATVPLYVLVGCFDPIVPALPVRRWLARNCPSYRGRKTIWFADHNVLGTAPAAAAGQVLQWLQS